MGIFEKNDREEHGKRKERGWVFKNVKKIQRPNVYMVSQIDVLYFLDFYNSTENVRGIDVFDPKTSVELTCLTQKHKSDRHF